MILSILSTWGKTVALVLLLIICVQQDQVTAAVLTFMLLCMDLIEWSIVLERMDKEED